MPEQKKDAQHYMRLLVKTSFFVFLSIFVSKIFGYLYKIVIARCFGPEQYGLFSLAVIISGILITFAMLGLSDGITRFIPFYRGKKDYKKIKHILKISIYITLVTSIVSSVLLYLLSDIIALSIFHNLELSLYLKIISFVGPFAAISSVFLAVVRGFEKVKTYSVLVNVFQNGSKLLFLLLLVYLGFEVNSLALSYLLSFVFLAIFSYVIGMKTLKAIAIKGSLKAEEKAKTTRELFSYSWPFIFVGLLYTLFYWTDSLVLGYFEQATYVGIYNAAITLVSLFGIAPDLFMQLFLPLITARYSENKRAMIRNLTKQVSKWIFMINLPLFMVIVAFPGVIINFFFGSEFLIAETPLRILALGALFSGFLSLLFGLISMKGDSKIILKSYLIFAIINLILDIFFIKFWGMTGAAIATASAGILFTFSFTHIIKKRLGFFPYKGILVKIVLVTATLLGVLFVLERLVAPTFINLVIIGFVFILAYLSLIILTGCLDKNDWMILKAVGSKIKRISGRGINP